MQLICPKCHGVMRQHERSGRRSSTYGQRGCGQPGHGHGYHKKRRKSFFEELFD